MRRPDEHSLMLKVIEDMAEWGRFHEVHFKGLGMGLIIFLVLLLKYNPRQAGLISEDNIPSNIRFPVEWADLTFKERYKDSADARQEKLGNKENTMFLVDCFFGFFVLGL